MSDPAFASAMQERRYEAHVEPLNRLVDDLISTRNRWMPHISPNYGGVNAEVLLLLAAPSIGADDQGEGNGSGFLCVENDDPTAQLLATCLDRAELDASRDRCVEPCPWVVPGYKTPSEAQVKAATEPLFRFIELLPDLHAVVLLGRMADVSWTQLKERRRDATLGPLVLKAPLPSGRGITKGGKQSRSAGEDELVNALLQARQHCDRFRR